MSEINAGIVIPQNWHNPNTRRQKNEKNSMHSAIYDGHCNRDDSHHTLSPSLEYSQNFHEICDSPRSLATPWTPTEDQILLEAVGVENRDWSAIARSLPGRTSKQCWHRFHNNLKHHFRTGDWALEEDAIILQQQAIIGNRWSQIARLLPERSENSVKNRWHSTLRPRMLRECFLKSAVEMESGKADCNSRIEFCADSALSASCASPRTEFVAAAYNLSLPSFPQMPDEDKGMDGSLVRSTNRGRRRSGLYDSPASPGRHARHRALLRALLRQPPPNDPPASVGAQQREAACSLSPSFSGPGEGDDSEGSDHDACFPGDYDVCFPGNRSATPFDSPDGVGSSTPRSETGCGEGEPAWWDSLGPLPSAAAADRAVPG